IIFNGKKDEQKGNLNYIQLDFSKNILPQLLFTLYELNIQSILLEGGKNILQQFIEQGLWNEARIFHSASRFQKGLKAPEIAGTIISTSHVDGDLLQILIKD